MQKPDFLIQKKSFEEITCFLENEFSEKLCEHNFWAVIQKGTNKIEEEGNIFDINTGFLYRPADSLVKILQKNSFLHVRKDGLFFGTLENHSNIIWKNITSEILKNEIIFENEKTTAKTTSIGTLIKGQFSKDEKENEAGDLFTVEQAKEILLHAWGAGAQWRLPSKQQLINFSRRSGNPYRTGRTYRLKDGSGTSHPFWLTDNGRVDLDDGFSDHISREGYGHIFACHDLFKNGSPLTICLALISENLSIEDPDSGDIFAPQPIQDLANYTIEELQKIWAKKGLFLHALDDSNEILDPSDYDAKQWLVNFDYTPCRLPKLDNARLTDPEQGLWELHNESDDFLREQGLTARNPSQDIQNRAVAIDFGTSSTVVAVDTPNGDRELLRIGVRDFYQAVAAHHFENPTVLECLDYNAFANVWQQEAYRPALNWDWMRAAHEAQTSLRDNPGNPEVLSSILPNIKHWALYSQEERRTRLSDRQGTELEIPPHVERNPVRGEALQVTEDDPFDPVELYAWYLGMAINWRGRGLFLKYYLSFPVKYDRDVKERILASFRCGLQRSLPQTLIDSTTSALNNFEVNDLATEPNAYAAAAMAALNIEPTDEGVPYGVFDFGGGTTDFDYGLMRYSTDEEDAQGYEVVFESLGSGGDQFLGGENLLNHLVYMTFSDLENLDELRKKRIQFTRPLDAKTFAGSESFLAATKAAQTNTIMLAAKLRTFIESDETSLDSEVTLDLLDTDHVKQSCTLSLNEQTLDAWLCQRIQDGFKAFISQLAHVHADVPSGIPIHCLLAGNGSRSRYITNALGETGIWKGILAETFGDAEPEVIVHPPLVMNDDDPHAPTAKTGVALGLLRIKPGENTLLINHVRNQHDGQAPFAWFVGRLRRGHFKPILHPGSAYDDWKELGPLQQGIFNLYSSQSPRSSGSMKAGDAELTKQRLDFPDAPEGAKLYAKASGPNEITLATADNEASIDVHNQENHVLA